jgi:hypothetical protein
MANLYITYFIPEAASTLETYFQSNEKEKLSRFVHQIEELDNLFKSFSNTSRGAPVFLNGGYGCIEIDPVFLKDLPQLASTGKTLLKQEIALGIGKDIKTSAIACKYSNQKHSGQKAVLFQPEMLEEMENMNKSELNKDENENEAQTGEPNDEDRIRQSIVDSLKLVNSQKEYIEELRQTDPKTYEAIKSVVSSMILMAQQMMNEPEEQEEDPTQKSELDKGMWSDISHGAHQGMVEGMLSGSARSAHDPKSTVTSAAIGAIKGTGKALTPHVKQFFGKDKDGLNKGAIIKPAAPPGKRRMAGKGPKRKIFAGSVKNGKRKTIDPLTGKSKWVTANPKR